MFRIIRKNEPLQKWIVTYRDASGKERVITTYANCEEALKRQIRGAKLWENLELVSCKKADTH